ncbi:MAG: branched-chain amino acid ABC transporter substrate-binding protein [Chloroflexi bacterium]|nr:branched-chain amino acid ABC transporter substrate-binding protein [Chloroflexota bacterium]
MKRSNKLMSLFGLIVVAGLVLSACGGAATTAAPAPTEAPAPTAVPPTEAPTEVPIVEIKFAFFAPLTGVAATLGQEQLALARLAVDDFNKNMTGYHATMVEEDTDITPDKAVPVCERDAADNTIVGVVGPSGSGQVEACAKILEDAGLAHVSPSATRPSLSQAGNKTFFRVVPNDDVQGKTDADYILKLGVKNVYVVDDQESYGTNLSDTVEKLLKDGGVTTARASVAQTDNDLSALVTKIKASKAELVFFAGQVSEQGALMAKQLKEQGVAIPVFGGDGFYSQKGYIDSAGGATEGSYASVFFPDIRPIAEAKSVVDAADKAFPTWGNFGAASYVAVTVFLEAAANASKAGSLDRAGVLDALKKTDTKVFGLPIAFDDTGEVKGASFVISQVKGGKFVQVFP